MVQRCDRLVGVVGGSNARELHTGNLFKRRLYDSRHASEVRNLGQYCCSNTQVRIQFADRVERLSASHAHRRRSKETGPIARATGLALENADRAQVSVRAAVCGRSIEMRGNI